MKGLEGVDPNAHAWDKHGPNVSDAFLQSQSMKSTAPQTKFASGDEMANAVSETLAVNMTDIQTMANSGQRGTVGFTGGPVVYYTGYYQGQFINGQAPTKIVIRFDGNGGWSLYSAYPYLYPTVP